MWAALSDSSAPAWSRLKRVWRIVGRHLLDRPEWLSARTEALRDIRFRRQRAERTTAAENFHRRLHALHTIGRSSALGASVFAVAVGLSVAVGVAFADAEVSDQVSGLAGTLVTIAEVVGGAAGILFAVIVFGIQYHGEKLDRAAFLVRYLRRREGLIPIAAFTLGVVAANIVVSLVCSLGLPYAAVPMAILDVPLVLFVLWLVLWLIHRMAVSVSEDFAGLLMPSLTWEYDRALDEDIRHARQRKVFEEATEDAGLEYSTVGGFTSLDRVAPVKLNLGGRGSVTDVNLTALKSLGDYIQSACPDHDGKLCVGPGDAVDNTIALVLSASRDGQGRPKPEVVAPDEGVVRDLRRHLQAVFQLGASAKHDVVEVLDRFQTMLVSYARSAPEEELDRWLDVQGTLIERGLARADVVPSSFSIHRERLPDFLGGFQHFEMAKNAVASGVEEKVSVLLTFAYRIMATAVHQEQHGMYHRAGQIIEAIYHNAIAGEKLADYVGGRIDSVLHSLSAQFEYAHSLSRRELPKIAAQMPALIADLGWRLGLIRTATEAGRTPDATNFQDRLFEWDRHATVRLADPNDQKHIPAELREACDLISYADLIVAAWCLRLTERNDKHADTAKAVYQRCASDLGTREHLVRLWEAVRGRRYGEKHIDELLGITHWTLPSPHRVGVSVGGWGGDAWIERGFIALLLKRPSARKHERPVALDSAPVFRPNAPEEIKTLANAVLGNEAVRTGLLNIADDKRDETVDAVVTLFVERLRLFKLGELQRVVAGQIDDARCRVLASETLAELRKIRGIVPALEQMGAGRATAMPSSRATAEYAMHFPRSISSPRRKKPCIWANTSPRASASGRVSRSSRRRRNSRSRSTNVTI